MTVNINTVIAGALAFLTALAWNDAVSKSIKSFFPMRHETDISIGVEVIDFYKDDYIMGTHNKRYFVLKSIREIWVHCALPRKS